MTPSPLFLGFSTGKRNRVREKKLIKRRRRCGHLPGLPQLNRLFHAMPPPAFALLSLLSVSDLKEQQYTDLVPSRLRVIFQRPIRSDPSSPPVSRRLIVRVLVCGLDMACAYGNSYMHRSHNSEILFARFFVLRDDIFFI